MINPPPMRAPAVMRAFGSIPYSSLVTGGDATRTAGRTGQFGLA
jgi:hypothetical protein